MAQTKAQKPLSILPIIQNHISEAEKRRAFFEIDGDSPGTLDPPENSYGQQDEFEQYAE